MVTRQTRNPVLASELDRFIDAQVIAGTGVSADAVAAETLTLLRDRLGRSVAATPVAWPIAGGHVAQRYERMTGARRRSARSTPGPRSFARPSIRWSTRPSPRC
ncbi:hypothetical protein QP185_13765 [Sphingomonas aerolata]|uniref:hypothetical protein n=1 Tax=Sphingomonas aerolata TaxID=185951 RepID=UPI002FDF9CC4